MSTRLSYLDLGKGLAIVLVVLGHIYAENPIKIWLYSFHLPLFFFISGCLLTLGTTRSIKTVIQNRLKSLMLPYALFSFVLFSLWAIKEFRKVSLETVIMKIINILSLQGIEALWFLPCLFISEILFLIIIRNIKSKTIIFLILLVFSVIPFVAKDYYNFKLFMRVFIATAFLGIGYYTFSYIKSRSFNILVPISLLAINIILGACNGLVDLYSLQLGNYILYFASAVSGILSILLFFKYIGNIKAISFLGVNSLIIMCTHIQLIAVVTKVISIIVSVPSSNLMANPYSGLLILGIVLLLEIPVIYIFNNYLSFFLGKREKCVSQKNVVSATE